MLTREENELLCRVEGDAPMGQLMRRHWLPVCLTEEVQRARRRPGQGAHVRRGPRRVPRHRGPRRRDGRVLPASPRVARVRPQRGMRAALPVSRLEDGRRGQRRRDGRPSRRERLAQKVKHKAYPTQRVAAASCGRTWARRRRCRSSSRRRGRRPDDARVSIAKVHRRRATGRRSSKARSTPRTARACTRPTCVPARVDGADGDRQGVAAAVDRQGAAAAGRAHRLRLPLRRDPPADHERGDARLRALTRLRRADHGADPAEQPVQRRATSTCRCDDTHTAFYFIAWGDPATRRIDRRPGASSAAQRVGIDLDQHYRPLRNARQQLLAGPRRR